MTMASGARFGRIMIANAAADPAAAAAPSPLRRLITQLMAQNATAGTSLIGTTAFPNITGVAAINRAAITPAHGVEI
jgi:hypothetical protein